MIKQILSNSLGFVTSKFRLVIEYALIGVVISLCGIVTYLHLQNNSMSENMKDTAKTLGTYEQSNRELGNAVQYLMQQREADSSVLAALIKDFDKFTISDKELSKRLRELEVRDANVKTYLDSAIPTELRKLLADEDGVPTSNNQNSDSQGKAAGSIDLAMRETAPGRTVVNKGSN